MEYTPVLNCRMDTIPILDSEKIVFTTPNNSSSVVDLSNRIPRVYNQGRIGSCTANALCSALRFIDSTFDPSRLFLYYNCRYYDLIYNRDNSVSIDDGTTLRQGINVLKRLGVCNEKTVPYIESRFAAKPSQKSYNEALNRQILNWRALNPTLQDLKNCLSSGFPFVFGILVYSSFFRGSVIPIPESSEQLLGGHALLCVGYDDDKRLFKFVNSWGTSWGDKGFGYIPYDYLTNNRLAWDFWVITNIERINVPNNPVSRRSAPIPTTNTNKHRMNNGGTIPNTETTVNPLPVMVIWTPSQLGKKARR